MATGWSIAEGSLPSDPTVSGSAVAFSPPKGRKASMLAACPAEMAGNGGEDDAVDESPSRQSQSDFATPNRRDASEDDDPVELQMQLDAQELAAEAVQLRAAEAASRAAAAETRLRLHRAKKASDAGSVRSRASRLEGRSPRGNPRLTSSEPQPSSAMAGVEGTPLPLAAVAPQQAVQALPTVPNGGVDEILELLEESSVAPSAAPTVDMRAPRLDGAILRGLGSESALARYRRSQPYSRRGTPPDLEQGGNAEPGGHVAHWEPQGPRWICGGSELGIEPSSGPSLLQRVFTYGIG